mmetsp:Transcript_2116/g.5898  ORF Transcript_2116/g.5898 Transcript_2116/m.5898 type:complete len:201 (-) Transcript_2116:126-728(-)
MRIMSYACPSSGTSNVASRLSTASSSSPSSSSRANSSSSTSSSSSSSSWSSKSPLRVGKSADRTIAQSSNSSPTARSATAKTASMRGSSSWMMTQSSSSSSSIEGAKATGWSQGVATTYHSPSSSSRMKQPGKQSMVLPVFVQRSAIGAASSSARRKSTARRGAPRGRGTGPVAMRGCGAQPRAAPSSAQRDAQRMLQQK